MKTLKKIAAMRYAVCALMAFCLCVLGWSFIGCGDEPVESIPHEFPHAEYEESQQKNTSDSTEGSPLMKPLKVLIYGLLFLMGIGIFAVYKDDFFNRINSGKSAQSNRSKKMNKFSDSVWTMLYSWAGGISLVAVFIGLISKQWEFALGFLFFASSCFFAAHLLRVQERTAHYSEQTANHSEQQTKLLEKILEERQKANPKKEEE